MMTTLDLYREHCPGTRLKQKGAREWAGPCPECGGEDRFVLQPDNPNGTGGRWMCRGCDRHGDAVAFVRTFVDPGMTYEQACHHIGAEPKPGYGGRGDGWSSKPRQERAPAQTNTAPEEWEPKDALLPSVQWMRQAAVFAGQCARALETEDGRAALKSRGLTVETARRLGIGWNNSDRYDSLPTWGLPQEVKPDTGRPRKMWLPKGLVVPFRRKRGIVGLFIRRMPWTSESKGPKCCQVKGGTDGAYCAGPAGLPVVIVESILDACLVRQEAGDLVSAVALTGAGKRPDKDTLAFLQAATLLLWALDNDKAGKAQWAWWRQHFPRAERCRPPGGPKDVGDYLQAGGSVRIWAQASLYNAQHREAAVPDTSLPVEPAGPSLPSQEASADTREKASVFSLSGSGGELLERLAPLVRVPGIVLHLQDDALQCFVPGGYETLAREVCRGYEGALMWFLRAQGGSWTSGAEGMAWLKAVATCWTVFEGRAEFFGGKGVRHE